MMAQSTDASLQAHQKRRDALIQATQIKRSDANEVLTEDERLLDAWMTQQHHAEVDAFEREFDLHPAQATFLHLKDQWVHRSRLWPVIKQMPKGAVLHAHFDSMVDCRWLVEQTHRQNCFMKEQATAPHTQFRFFAAPPADNAWLHVPTVRKSHPGGPEAFDTMLFERMTLVPAIRRGVETIRDGELWSLFIDTFAIAAGLICYKPVFKLYMQEKLQRLKEDGVAYIEERLVGIATQLYDDECDAYPIDETIQLYRECVRDFITQQQTQSDGNGVEFVDAKIIYSGVRLLDQDVIRKDLHDALRLKTAFPDVICGFDLVGHEDAGHTLAYYMPDILDFERQVKEKSLVLPCVWHAGETVGAGVPASDNLYDAILLNPPRIGHGLALAKYPHLQEMVKERGITIELCPISNKVLKYTPLDLRLHPLMQFINNGLKVVVAPDDPAIFGDGQHPASFDFWTIYLTWPAVTLSTLKYLCRQSLEVRLHQLLMNAQSSLMEPGLKGQALDRFKRDWNAWVQSQISQLDLK